MKSALEDANHGARGAISPKEDACLKAALLKIKYAGVCVCHITHWLSAQYNSPDSTSRPSKIQAGTAQRQNKKEAIRKHKHLSLIRAPTASTVIWMVLPGSVRTFLESNRNSSGLDGDSWRETDGA